MDIDCEGCDCDCQDGCCECSVDCCCCPDCNDDCSVLDCIINCFNYVFCIDETMVCCCCCDFVLTDEERRKKEEKKSRQSGYRYNPANSAIDDDGSNSLPVVDQPTFTSIDHMSSAHCVSNSYQNLSSHKSCDYTRSHHDSEKICNSGEEGDSGGGCDSGGGGDMGGEGGGNSGGGGGED